MGFGDGDQAQKEGQHAPETTFAAGLNGNNKTVYIEVMQNKHTLKIR